MLEPEQGNEIAKIIPFGFFAEPYSNGKDFNHTHTLFVYVRYKNCLVIMNVKGTSVTIRGGEKNSYLAREAVVANMPFTILRRNGGKRRDDIEF
ncbi:MAG: hypothetical protein QMD22_03060 [archaeon]|nr:hypothetical protein [archaeon]